MRCFGPLKDLAPTRRGEERRREERTIEESAPARARGTCVQLPVTLVRFAYKRIYLAKEGGDGNGGGGGGGGERTTAVGDGCTTQIPPSV